MENSTSDSVLSINYLWIGNVLGIVIAIEGLTLYTAQFEFLCAQTPYTLKGLIIGLSFASALGLSPALADATLTTWAHTWSQPLSYPTCAFWFYLFTIVVTVVGVVMFCIVAKWYKRRKETNFYTSKNLWRTITINTFTESLQKFHAIADHGFMCDYNTKFLSFFLLLCFLVCNLRSHFFLLFSNCISNGK